MWEIPRVLLVPQTIVMDMNNVTSLNDLQQTPSSCYGILDHKNVILATSFIVFIVAYTNRERA